MRPRRSFTDIRKALSNQEPVDAVFLVHWMQRHPVTGPGCAALGLRDGSFLSIYKEELQWAFNYLTQAVSLAPPALLPVDVYVFEPAEEDGDPSPRTFPELHGSGKAVLSLALASRTPIPNLAAQQAYLRAAAVHETAHAVCFGQPAFGSAFAAPWVWFAEGTAEWLSFTRLRQTDPDNVSSFELLLDWVDYPQLPINQDPDSYSAAMFVDYLVRLYNLDLLGAIWRAASPDNEPWRVIKAQTGPGDLFLDFCLDAYTLNRSAPDLFRRFGPRGREHTLPVPGPSASQVFQVKICDFGCRYFALVPGSGDKRFSIAVRAGEPRVRAAAVAVSSDYKPLGSSLALSDRELALNSADYPGLDHFAVVITTEPEQSYPEVPDQVPVELSIRGI